MSQGFLTAFTGPVEELAPRLLGMRLKTDFPPGPTEVLITEVEAYAGGRDPASHAFRGRTARNASMFGASGLLYVYRSYGIHWCMNVVTGRDDDPSAVLLRGGVPLMGESIMVERRGRDTHIADGPGKLTQALGVTGDHDGTSVVAGPVLLLGEPDPRHDVVVGPRVGITKAIDRPWRFRIVVTP